MSFFALLTTFLFIGSTSAGWVLEDDYNPSNFFDMFSFWTGADPTHGFVDYLSQSDAQSAGLINNNNGGIYIGVDSTNQAPNGRESVRITSNKVYNAGSLVILDLAHMPGGICATWPAFWTVGPNWPAGGEIDIIEGVHTQTTNDITLHTSPGCSISNNGAFSGHISTDNCYIYADGQTANAGCQIQTSNTATYGAGFNAVGGGVYAMEWTTEAISVYFFQRGSIPSDISSGNPNPAGWGEPIAQFQGACDIPNFFTDNQLVFDNTFCGDWAGATWGSSGCASDQYPTCESFVANNPSAFQESFWQINGLKVYSQTSGDSPSAPSSASSAPVWTSSAVAAPMVYSTTLETSMETSTTTVPAQTPAVSISISLAHNQHEPSFAQTSTVATSTPAAATPASPAPAPAATSATPGTMYAVVGANNLIYESEFQKRQASSIPARRNDFIGAKLFEELRRKLEAEKLKRMRHVRNVGSAIGKWRF
ncbi:hypothetical protein MBLNU457_g0244t2 [Dothideomycetes sp. NU457]